MNKMWAILQYIVTLVAGILLTIAILLKDNSIFKAITLGTGLGLYNSIIYTLISKTNKEE